MVARPTSLGPPGTILPAEWGAVKDYLAWNDLWVPKDKFITHWGTSKMYSNMNSPTVAQAADRLRKVEAYHLSRKWRGAAYSAAFDNAGNIFWIRGWNHNGAHLRADVDEDGISENVEGFAAFWIGGGGNIVSPQAFAAWNRLHDYVSDEMGFALPDYGHKEVQASKTSCPGPVWMARIKATRQGDEWPYLLRAGDKHPRVRILRGMLFALDYLENVYGGTDEHYTTTVVNGVRAFQIDAHIAVDGITGPQTRSHLYAAIANTE